MNKRVKSKVGRPKTTVKERVGNIPLDLDKLSKLYKAGWTDEQVADFIGIDYVTLNRWKKDNEFMQPLKDWKFEADAKVERSLYQRAIGYKYDEITYEKLKVGGLGVQFSDGEVSDIKNVDAYKTKIVIKEVVADVTACIFWLKNRQSAQWREKHEVEHTGKLEVTVKHEEVEERLSCFSAN